MNIITTLLASFAIGFASNYIETLVKKVTQPGWKSFTLYAIRSTAKAPAVMLVEHELRKPHVRDGALSPKHTTLISYILASSMFGLGIIVSLLVNSRD